MMGRLLKSLVLVVVAIVAISYVVYALDYKGNYNLVVTVGVARDSINLEASVTGVDWESEPTDMVDWWDVMRSRVTTEGSYALMLTLNVSEDNLMDSVVLFNIDSGESVEREMWFDNIEPGTYTLTVELYYRYTATTVYLNYFEVKVGV